MMENRKYTLGALDLVLLRAVVYLSDKRDVNVDVNCFIQVCVIKIDVSQGCLQHHSICFRLAYCLSTASVRHQ